VPTTESPTPNEADGSVEIALSPASAHPDETEQLASAPLEYPELVIAIAGPIGVDIDLITNTLCGCLSDVGYASSVLKLTELMERYKVDGLPRQASDIFELMNWKMDYANALRAQNGDAAFLARVAIREIREIRFQLTRNRHKPKAQQAYIIRQLKRPEEVDLLRQVYGRQFILISAYAAEVERRAWIEQKLKDGISTQTPPAEISFKALQLIERDQSETDGRYGQALSETFHIADAFIDGSSKAKSKDKLTRFIQALFGRNDISPSKDEYGAYAAKSASLRSADLSRQVGAAIFSDSGELITQGCNEVPKANGGTYWEEPDFRDIKKGHDPNEKLKREILRDLVERLRKADMLSDELKGLNDDNVIVDRLTSKDTGGKKGVLSEAMIMDLTEYGRVVHAEMGAICDAARLGRSVRGATLYVTTFPCHNCTKHILSSGIKRVVYVEPYPKSKAKDLHEDEIEFETSNDPLKVSFVPFMGISPFRYRDIFQKRKRKRPASKYGEADEWYNGRKRPLLDVVFPSYTRDESWALHPLIVKPEAGSEHSEVSMTSEDADVSLQPSDQSKTDEGA
jgi:deoxycytidylate deaminase